MPLSIMINFAVLSVWICGLLTYILKLGPRSASDLLWSVCPSVCPSEIFFSEHILFPLGSNFTHGVPLDKGGAVILNIVFKLKLKVIAELDEKSLSGAYRLSLHSRSNFTQSMPIDKGCAVTELMKCVGQRSGSYLITQKFFFFSEHIYSPVYPIWLILHRVFE